MATQPVFPPFVLRADITQGALEEQWLFNDGTGSNSDQNIPNSWRLVYDLSITSVRHSSHLITDWNGTKEFSGIDLKRGMWISTLDGGRSMRIIDILSAEQSSATVILEDTYRYNTWQHQQSAGQSLLPNGPAIIFEVTDDLLANTSNVVSQLVNSFLSAEWGVNITAKFGHYKDRYGIYYEQLTHGFSEGQLLRIAKPSESTQTVAIGTNTSPSVTSGEIGNINDTRIEWPSSFVNATDIVNFLNSLNLDHGAIIASVGGGGEVVLTASDGRDIIVNDRFPGSSFSTGLGISDSGNGIQAGQFVGADGLENDVVAIVSRLGPDLNSYFYKWLGKVQEYDQLLPGFVGDKIFRTKDGFLSTNDYEESKGVLVKLDNRRPGRIVSANNASIPAGFNLVACGTDTNRRIIINTDGSLNTLVNDINTAFSGATDGVFASVGGNGEFILESPSGLDFQLIDLTSSFSAPNNLKPIHQNGSNKARAVLLQHPTVPKRKIFLPRFHTSTITTPPNDGDVMSVTINGNLYNVTLNDQGSGSPLTVGGDEIAIILNSNVDLVYEGIVATWDGINLVINNTTGGELELADVTGTPVTGLFGTSTVTALPRGGHGHFFDALNNSGSTIPELTVVKKATFSAFNDINVVPVDNVVDIPIGVMLTTSQTTERAKFLQYGIIYTNLDTSGASFGDRIYFDSVSGLLTLTPGTVPVGFVYEISTNAQVFIDIGSLSSSSEELVWYTVDASSSFGSTQQETLPADAADIRYVFINGLGSTDYTFNSGTKLFEHIQINAGFPIQTNDEVTFVYLKS